MSSILILLLLTGIAIAPNSAAAHAANVVDQRHLWSDWNWDPTIILPLLLGLFLYLRGLGQMWRRVGPGRGTSYARATFFLAGLATLFVALVSPVDSLADALLSMHMIQHLVLILIAAPLLVLGKPLVPMLWALPRDWRVALGRGWKRNNRVQSVWSELTQPVATGIIFTVTLLLWHIPPLYQAALRSDAIHAAEHASFLGIGLLFWWVVIQPNRQQHRSVGASIALLALAMTLGSVLGALMTFSGTVWYPAYEPLASGWSRSALEDQQLAGLIMWIPAGAVYLCAALGLLGSWFHLADAEDDNLVYPLARIQERPARQEAARS